MLRVLTLNEKTPKIIFFYEFKKTVVLGPSNNPNRYSFLAVNKLVNYGHPVVAVGIKKAIFKI